MNRTSLSVSDKLLLAAYRLEEDGIRPFSAEDLVVAAWERFPDTFGLAGHRGKDGQLLYPDSNRVFAEIMGTKPIRERGLLIKVGNKMYQLTEAGRDHARLLLGRPAEPSLRKAGLGRDVEQELKRLLNSRAFEKYRARRIQDLTFHDASTFWRISPRSSAIEMEGRFANFSRILSAAKEVASGETVSFEHGGYRYSALDVDDLFQLHQEMIRKFAAEVETIRKRTDERKTRGNG